MLIIELKKIILVNFIPAMITIFLVANPACVAWR